MPSAKAINKPGHITTGNVLEDLGFSPQEIHEMEMKHDLWLPIRAEIEARKLTQSKLAKELQIHQPDASLLLRGQIERFRITRLLEFARRLRLAVRLSVAPMASDVNVPALPRVAMRKPAVRLDVTKSKAERSAALRAAAR